MSDMIATVRGIPMYGNSAAGADLGGSGSNAKTTDPMGTYVRPGGVTVRVS